MKRKESKIGKLIFGNILFLGCLLGFQSHADNKLVDSGNSDYVIVVAEKPDKIVSYVRVGKSMYPLYIFPGRKKETVMYVAQEFQKWIEKVTGVRIPILHENDKIPEGKKKIFIGSSKLAEKSGLTAKGLKPEGYYIKTGDDYIGIIGEVSPKGIDRGTIFGIYDFLERVLGLRWYFPGELGTVVPEKKTVPVPKLDMKVAPAFNLRVDGGLGYADVKSRKDKSKDGTGNIWLDWLPALRHGGTSDVAVNHTMMTWGKDFSKEHPEYFAINNDGTQTISRKMSTRENHICYSRKDVMEQELKNIEEWITKGKNYWECGATRPTDVYCYFCPNDVHKMFGICHCKECLKKWRPEDTFGEYSDIIFGYAADLAREIKKRWPERRLVVAAYESYEAPPEHVEIPDNLDIMLCELRGPVMQTQPGIWDAEARAINRWFELLGKDRNRLNVWHYFCYPNMFFPNVPMLAARTLAKWHKVYQDKVGGLFNNGMGWYQYPGVQLNFFMVWLWHKLLWDPNADPDKLTDDFCKNMFGPAYRPMLEFFKLEIDQWENTHWSQYNEQCYIPEKVLFREIYPPKVVNRLKQLLEDSRKLTEKGSIYRKRVDWYAELHQNFFEEDELYNHWYKRLVQVKIKKEDPQTDWWKKSQAYPLLQVVLGQKPGFPTNVYFAHDEKNILIHAVLDDPDTSKLVITGDHNNDLRIKKDDSLKICFDLEDKAYYHYLVFNAAGYCYAGIESPAFMMRGKHLAGHSTEWKLSVMPKAEVIKEKDKWILNIKIPLAIFAPYKIDKQLYTRGLRLQVERKKRTSPGETTVLCPLLQPPWEFPITRFGVAEFLK